jgi:hypothetical protein
VSSQGRSWIHDPTRSEGFPEVSNSEFRLDSGQAVSMPDVRPHGDGCPYLLATGRYCHQSQKKNQIIPKRIGNAISIIGARP